MARQHWSMAKTEKSDWRSYKSLSEAQAERPKKARGLPCESETSKAATNYVLQQIRQYPRTAAYFQNANPYFRIARKYLNGEDVFHYFLVAYLKEYHADEVLIIHAPNEGKRGNVETAKLQMMGVRSGACDLQLIHRTKILHPTFWAELKWDASVSKEQKVFIEQMKAAGHHAEIYKKDFGLFRAHLLEWLKRD